MRYTHKKYKRVFSFDEMNGETLIIFDESWKDVDLTGINIRGKKIIFSNSGDVILKFKQFFPKSLSFNNGGNVFIESGIFHDNVQILKTDLSFKNSGDVKWISVGNTKIISNISFENNGNILLNGIEFSRTKVDIKNKGDIDFVDILVKKHFIIKNYGDVYLNGNSRFEVESRLLNSGNVYIKNSDISRKVGERTEFLNAGDVYISDVELINIYFKNNGNLYFLNDSYVLFQGIYISNIGNVSFENIEEIVFYDSSFKNRGNIIFKKLKRFGGKVLFENGKDVTFNVLEDFSTVLYLKFSNGGNVNFPKTRMTEKMPIFTNGGNITAKEIDSGKRTNCEGLIISNSDYYMSSKSFLKRNNIKIDNGKVILIKGVVSESGIATYDNSKTKWNEIGKVNRVEYWNPYDNEIGVGKFVASYDYKIFGKLLNCNNIKYYKIEIDLLDLYEYPFPKYPQLIGFREGKIIEEVKFEK